MNMTNKLGFLACRSPFWFMAEIFYITFSDFFIICVGEMMHVFRGKWSGESRRCFIYNQMHDVSCINNCGINLLLCKIKPDREYSSIDHSFIYSQYLQNLLQPIYTCSFSRFICILITFTLHTSNQTVKCSKPKLWLPSFHQKILFQVPQDNIPQV